MLCWRWQRRDRLSFVYNLSISQLTFCASPLRLIVSNTLERDRQMLPSSWLHQMHHNLWAARGNRTRDLRFTSSQTPFSPLSHYIHYRSIERQMNENAFMYVCLHTVVLHPEMHPEFLIRPQSYCLELLVCLRDWPDMHIPTRLLNPGVKLSLAPPSRHKVGKWCVVL